jgi:hypothetical protein
MIPYKTRSIFVSMIPGGSLRASFGMSDWAAARQEHRKIETARKRGNGIAADLVMDYP